MSWSDDTRCLYCDGKLPLYRKLTNGQFCSTPHQKAYWKEQERLAVEVLHRTHDALMAFRPQGDIELIIGPAVGWDGSSAPTTAPATTPTPISLSGPSHEPLRSEPVQSQVERPGGPSSDGAAAAEAAPDGPFMETSAPTWSLAPQTAVNEPAPPSFGDFLGSSSPESVAPRWTVLPLLRAEDPAPCETLFFDVPLHPIRETVTAPAGNQLQFPTEPVRVPVEAAAIAWAGHDGIPFPIRPSAPLLVASGLEPQILECKLAPEVTNAPPQPAIPEFTIAQSRPEENQIEPLSTAPRYSLGETEVPSRLVFVDTMVSPDPVAAEGPALLEELADLEVEQIGPIPTLAGWRHKQVSWSSDLCTVALVERDSQELGFPQQVPQTPAFEATAAEFCPAGLAGMESPQKLSLQIAQCDPHPHPATLTWFRLGAFNPPQLIASSLTGIEPGVRLAGGCRYATKRTAQAPLASPVRGLSFGAIDLVISFPALPENDRRTALPISFAPGLGKLVSLTAWKSEIPARAAQQDATRSRGSGQAMALSAAPFSTATWLPVCRLEPLKWAVSPPPPEVPVEKTATPVAAAELPPAAKPHPHLGHFLVGFWKNAPRDLRLLMFAIPALLALAFHPSLPKVHVSTVQATEPVQKNVGHAINGSWTSFKQVVSERAAVALDEDFRSGLDDWASPGGNATEWSFDANGFVRPGSLALYSPSLSLADYEAQFLGVIDQKSLSWVVRAEDFSNYYVVKLVVRKPGPLTTLGLTRYAVIDGKPQDRVDAVVPFTARPDMLYRVHMDVHDDSFVLAIQGQMVDAWSEPRLKKGGIGFFSAQGEGSRVRWLQVTHQYDMLGRLCSYLAPYDQSAVVMPTETTKNSSTKNNGSWQQ